MTTEQTNNGRRPTHGTRKSDRPRSELLLTTAKGGFDHGPTGAGAWPGRQDSDALETAILATGTLTFTVTTSAGSDTYNAVVME